MTPRRIQRRRTKGWRMPPGAIYVGRPTKWGNPFKTGDRVQDVDFFKRHRPYNLTVRNIKRGLKGKNLACWCPLDQPCHADVLLEIANREGKVR